MPFDALLLRKLSHEWSNTLVGCSFDSGQYGSGDVVLFGRHAMGGRREAILIGLKPGRARMHRTQSHPRPRKKTVGMAFFSHLLPFTLTAVHVPPWERVVDWTIRDVDDLGEPRERHLIAELTGRLTNLVLTDASYRVVDAVKRFGPKAGGRTVLPGQPYTFPPPLPDPCQRRDPNDFPPRVRTLIAADPGFGERVCRDYAAGTFDGFWLIAPDGKETDLWVYPVPGYKAIPEPDLEFALDDLYTRIEAEEALARLRSQLAAQWRDHLHHLDAKIAEFTEFTRTDGEDCRRLGDLWLAHQTRFTPAVRCITVQDFSTPPQTVELTLPEGGTPQEEAQRSYRRYKKIKGRRDAARAMLPGLEAERAQYRKKLADLDRLHPPEWYQQQLSAARQNSPVGAAAKATSYRRFLSINRFPILVGRSADENQTLTFRTARPDDLWFHVKQSQGAHVILVTERRQPQREDVLDAAHLAAFYSKISSSSMIPVDYTRRKFVKKRPHAEPGQVLYQREKTLYVTPESDRLKRLGAVGVKLGDEA